MSPIVEILLILTGVVAGIIVSISVFKLHPAIALGIAAILTGLVLGFGFTTILNAMYTGFRNVVLGVGVVIILGAVLGTLMEHSGAMDTIIAYVLRIFGKDRPITSLSVLGLVIGIPVFCDSGFIILSRVANGMADQRGLKRRYTAMALAGGLYTAHTLIPPTPGPVAAAGNFGMSGQLGMVLGSGLLVSIPILLVLILGTTWLSRKQQRDRSITLEEHPAAQWTLLLPVIIAMLLISLGSVATAMSDEQLPILVKIIVHPVTALFIAALIAWGQIPAANRKFLLWKKGFTDALPIVLITGMGGAFGQVLKESSLAASLAETFTSSGGSAGHLLLIGFAGALIIKTAQGSSTAAIVITSSILYPLATGLTMWQTALLISAIGSGAMAISHANDSYFWVVSKFSDLSVRESYQYFSVLTLVLAVTGLISCWLLIMI